MLANILESERNLTRQHDVSKINRSGKPGKRTCLLFVLIMGKRMVVVPVWMLEMALICGAVRFVTFWMVWMGRMGRPPVVTILMGLLLLPLTGLAALLMIGATLVTLEAGKEGAMDTGAATTAGVGSGELVTGLTLCRGSSSSVSEIQKEKS